MIVSKDVIEVAEARIAELETELQSVTDELFEKDAENQALRLELQRLMADRSLAV